MIHKSLHLKKENMKYNKKSFLLISNRSTFVSVNHIPAHISFAPHLNIYSNIDMTGLNIKHSLLNSCFKPI